MAIVESYSGDVRIDGKPLESTLITGPVEIATGRKSRVAIELGNGDKIRIGSKQTIKLKDPCSNADYDPYKDKDRFWEIRSKVQTMRLLNLFGADDSWRHLQITAPGVRGRLLPESGQDDLFFARLSYPRVGIQSDIAGISLSSGVHLLRHLAQVKPWPLAHTSNHFGSPLTSFTDQTSAPLEAGFGEADPQELLPSQDELSSAIAAAIVAIDSQHGSTIWVLKGAVEVMAHDSATPTLHAPGGLADGVLPSPYHFDAKQLKIRAKQ